MVVNLQPYPGLSIFRGLAPVLGRYLQTCPIRMKLSQYLTHAWGSYYWDCGTITFTFVQPIAKKVVLLLSEGPFKLKLQTSNCVYKNALPIETYWQSFIPIRPIWEVLYWWPPDLDKKAPPTPLSGEVYEKPVGKWKEHYLSRQGGKRKRKIKKKLENWLQRPALKHLGSGLVFIMGENRLFQTYFHKKFKTLVEQCRVEPVISAH